MGRNLHVLGDPLISSEWQMRVGIPLIIEKKCTLVAINTIPQFPQHMGERSSGVYGDWEMKEACQSVVTSSKQYHTLQMFNRTYALQQRVQLHHTIIPKRCNSLTFPNLRCFTVLDIQAVQSRHLNHSTVSSLHSSDKLE